MNKIVLVILFGCSFFTAQSQLVTQLKKELDTTSNPLGLVKYKYKKKYKIDTVAIISTTTFFGLADSIASKGKTGKVYGPFKGSNVLVKILAKVPGTFYHFNHIVLDTSIFKPAFADSLADNIINRITSGSTSFESMAATYSADRSSSSKGGDMGWFVKGVMMPDLEKTVVGGKKGALLKVWTSAGLHIVYIKSSPKTDNAYALLLRVFL